MHFLAFSFGFKDLIDIMLVAGILYETYRLLHRTGASNLFWGILSFLIVWFLVSFVFDLELTGALFDRIISVGAIALIVIFQEEIRMFFYRVGSRFSSWKLFNRTGTEGCRIASAGTGDHTGLPSYVHDQDRRPHRFCRQ